MRARLPWEDVPTPLLGCDRSVGSVLVYLTLAVFELLSPKINIIPEITMSVELPSREDTLPPLSVVGGTCSLPGEDTAVVPKLAEDDYRSKSYQCLRKILP